MKKIFSFIVLLMSLHVFVGALHSQDDIFYARCNLKVIKGDKITWVNWQSAREFIPCGKKLSVTRDGKKAKIEDLESGKFYTLDIGADGDQFMGKFISREPVSIDAFPSDVQSNIGNAIARLGMTKEQVYLAMGPPAWAAGGNTDTKTYEDIMGANLWVYKRRRFGKNIGVEFDPQTDKVKRTEGIWGK